MLRFYAEQHILVPAYTDPQTGYRRYLSSQLIEARFLLRLRGADFSVEDIRSIMGEKEKEELHTLGKEQRAILDRKIRALENSLKELEALEREWETPRYGLLRVEPLRVYSAPFRGERGQLRALARRAAEELVSAFPEAPPRIPFLCAYGLEKGPEDVMLHIPGNADCPGVLPGGIMATVLHRGAYEKLPETLEGLLEWVRDQGYALQGTVREWYFPNDEEEVDHEEIELSLPLVEKSF